MRRVDRAREAARAWQERKDEEMRQLLRFEHLFFQIKDSSKDYVSLELLHTFLSYAAMGHSAAKRAAMLRKLSRDPKLSGKRKHSVETDGTTSASQLVTRVDRATFVRCCAELCADVPADTLDLAALTFRETSEMLENQETERRVERARQIDQHAKVIMPTAFITFLLALFGITFTDSYAPPNQARDGSSTRASVATMFVGFGQVSDWAPWSIAASITFPLTMGLIIYGSSSIKSFLAQRKLSRRIDALQRASQLQWASQQASTSHVLTRERSADRL